MTNDPRPVTGKILHDGSCNIEWTSIVHIRDSRHFHMELRKTFVPDFYRIRDYGVEWEQKYREKFNGHYVYHRDGDSYTVTRNGELVESDTSDSPRGGYSGGIWQECTCAALAQAYGEEFTGYEHNYVLANDHATWEE